MTIIYRPSSKTIVWLCYYHRGTTITYTKVSTRSMSLRWRTHGLNMFWISCLQNSRWLFCCVFNQFQILFYLYYALQFIYGTVCITSILVTSYYFLLNIIADIKSKTTLNFSCVTPIVWGSSVLETCQPKKFISEMLSDWGWKPSPLVVQANAFTRLATVINATTQVRYSIASKWTH